MSQTLKERYETQLLNAVSERASKADQELMIETKTANMLIEAMNAQDLKKASEVIDKLRTLKGKGFVSLDTAIDKAIAELNKYTGGGPLTQTWAKLKTKVGIDNPLVKVMTFSNALETGFKQIPTILKNNLGEITQEMSTKSANDVIQDENVKTNISNNLLKALSPAGVFGAFKRVPYVDNMKILIQDLLSAPLKNLNDLVKLTTSGPQTAEIAADIKDVAQGQGDVETKGTLQGQQATPAGQSTPATPAKGTDVTAGAAPTGQKPIRPETGNDIRPKVIEKVKPALQDLGIKNVDAVIAALDDLGVLKAP